MSRGARGDFIFKEDDDFDMFLMILRKCQKKYEFKIHSYCLMSNHYHLQIETQDVDLSIIMEKLLKSYSNYFNFKYHFKGHVFQGRYKGKLIEDSVYFLETGRYIHLNPVKAGIVKHPEEYRYSSYRFYVSNRSYILLTTDRTLSFFSQTGAKGYAEFVNSKADHEEYEADIMKDVGEV